VNAIKGDEQINFSGIIKLEHILWALCTFKVEKEHVDGDESAH
jgi:hypothetical protein